MLTMRYKNIENCMFILSEKLRKLETRTDLEGAEVYVEFLALSFHDTSFENVTIINGTALHHDWWMLHKNKGFKWSLAEANRELAKQGKYPAGLCVFVIDKNGNEIWSMSDDDVDERF